LVMAVPVDVVGAFLPAPLRPDFELGIGLISTCQDARRSRPLRAFPLRGPKGAPQAARPLGVRGVGVLKTERTERLFRSASRENALSNQA